MYPIELSNTCKITNATWFSPVNPYCDIPQCIGIVTVETLVETKKYIGYGTGIDEKQDAISIAQHGSPYYGA